MKLGISREELPELVKRLGLMLGGTVSGSGMGMLLAVALVADDERTVFDARFFFLAWALICVGSFITPVTHRLEGG